MNKEIICVVCPLGCRMAVEIDNTDVTSVRGHQCKEGKKHAQKEVFFPGRILTTTVKTDSTEIPLLPVRSNQEIPKDKLINCMQVINNYQGRGSIKIEQTLIKNILGLGVDIVASRSLIQA